MPWALGARRSTREARASNARAMRGSEQRHVRVRQGSLLHAVGGGGGGGRHLLPPTYGSVTSQVPRGSEK